MTRSGSPKPGTPAWRRARSEKMSEIRSAKALTGICRQCPALAKVLPDGRVLKSCRRHLRQDLKRVAARKRQASSVG